MFGLQVQQRRGVKTWGKFGIKQVGFYEYGTSPFHMRPFKGFLQPGLFKFARRMATHAPFILPPMAAYYALAVWADKKFEYYNRKVYLESPEGRAAMGH
ncbi:MAG: hypothetical protein SGCHY_003586 [Lobulomycetales sp.]